MVVGLAFLGQDDCRKVVLNDSKKFDTAIHY
jgi:hypothetical protein